MRQISDKLRLLLSKFEHLSSLNYTLLEKQYFVRQICKLLFTTLVRRKGDQHRQIILLGTSWCTLKRDSE